MAKSGPAASGPRRELVSLEKANAMNAMTLEKFVSQYIHKVHIPEKDKLLIYQCGRLVEVVDDVSKKKCKQLNLFSDEV